MAVPEVYKSLFRTHSEPILSDDCQSVHSTAAVQQEVGQLLLSYQLDSDPPGTKPRGIKLREIKPRDIRPHSARESIKGRTHVVAVLPIPTVPFDSKEGGTIWGPDPSIAVFPIEYLHQPLHLHPPPKDPFRFETRQMHDDTVLPNLLLQNLQHPSN